MRKIKQIYLSLLAFMIIVAGGCIKENPIINTPEQITELIAFCNEAYENGFDNYLNVAWFKLDESIYDADKKEVDAQKQTFNYSGDVTYSYQVREKISGSQGVISSTNKEYKGTLREDAFKKGEVNTVEVVRSGSGWKLLVNGADADKPTGNNNGSANVWKRVQSPKGYQTDLAIGGIPGEPESRVYMCEHPGSPSEGLYKGNISGETITWDAVHGLPAAKFYKRDGMMRLWFTVGPEDDAGKYESGVWTNTCGALGK